MNLKPQMKYKAQVMKAQPQANHIEMKVMLPLAAKTALETKLAGKLEATVAGILSMLAEGDIMIIPSTDLDRIKQRLGKKPESSGELFGMIYSLSLDAETAKQEAETARKDLAAYEGTGKGRVVIDLGELYGATAARANEENMPTKVWLERQVRNALENHWF